MENERDMNTRRGLTAVVIVLCFVLLISGGYMLTKTMYNYRETLVRQQQDAMLNVVRSVATSVESYIIHEQENLEVFAQSYGVGSALDAGGAISNGELLDSEVLAYMAYKPQVRAVFMLFSAELELIYRYSGNQEEYRLLEEFDADSLMGLTGGHVLDTYLTEDQFYTLALGQPILKGGQCVAYAVSMIDLRDMFSTLIRPVSVDDKGYAMAKDSDGIILDHPVTSHIGTHAIYGREEMYPDVDFSSMATLIDKELQGEEGVLQFDSFWFSEDADPVKAPKFSAFTPLNMGDGFWVIGLNIDYDDFMTPLMRSMMNGFYIFGFFILIVLILGLYFFQAIRKSRDLERETQHLRELNQVLDELYGSEERLRHYEKLQVIDTMTSGMAHEFNNLLTPILVCSELLEAQLPKGSMEQQDAGEILMAATRAKELVSQISSLSYRDADGGYSSIRLDELLPQWMRSLKLLSPKGVELSLNCPGEEIRVYGSGTQLYQVLLNLCANAFHAMEESGGKLTITLSRKPGAQLPDSQPVEQPEQDYAVIEVSDTGCGMEEEVLAQIFDPFFTTKQAGEGTGLGLALAQNIMHSHGGLMWAESSPGYGSTFTLCMPCSGVEGETRPREQMPAAVSEVEEGLSILLVDDQRRVVESLARGLRHRGYDVQICLGGDQAMDILRSAPGRFSVLVTDYAMPGMSGIELAQRVRQYDPSMKILLITGMIKNDVLKGMRTGMISGYMAKPVGAKALAAKLSEITNRPIS